MNAEDMEQGQTLPQESPAENTTKSLEITDDIKKYLNQSGNWGKFLAILGFIFMGFMVLGGFIMSVFMSFIPNQSMPGLPFPGYLFGLIYLIFAIIYFLPILYLYRFSAGIKQALLYQKQSKFENAFLNLKRLYRFMGIFTIVIISIYVILIIIMMLTGLFAGISALSGTAV